MKEDAMAPCGRRKALIIIDVLNDFCKGGALAVPNGELVVPVIENLLLTGEFDLVVVGRDWHPADHCSFKENGGKWPRHGVQNTWGAELHPDLRQALLEYPPSFLQVRKGYCATKEAYSCFDGYPNLDVALRLGHISTVYVCGLATDYCVKATALDAKKAGFKTFFVFDACHGVEAKTTAQAVKEMEDEGIERILSEEV